MLRKLQRWVARLFAPFGFSSCCGAPLEEIPYTDDLVCSLCGGSSEKQ